MMSAAAQNLASVASGINAANAAAAASTMQIPAAAQDEVSAAIAALFGRYADEYQALGARATALHDQFVAALSSGSRMYAATEAANVSPLQTLEDNILGA